MGVIMNRRTLLSATALTLPMAMLAGCGTATDATTKLAMAQLYADDLADAISAAAQVLLAGPPPMSAAQASAVTTAVANMQAARKALDAATVATDARSIAQQLLAAAQQLAPMITAVLGPVVALDVQLAISVVRTFVDTLPPPVGAGPTPPAALHRAAMKYHGRH
jgi:hypothetical protein